MSTNTMTTHPDARPDYHAMIRQDLEALIDKYANLALTQKGINPRWIMALRMAELFLS